MKTYVPSATEIKRAWHEIDAQDQIIGRVATQAAILLMGKHKPTFVRNLDSGDHVVILNAERIVSTGRKETQKIYAHHTGHVGGYRQTTLSKLRVEDPAEIIKHAVFGMLPKNKLRDNMIKRLYVVIGSEHQYGKYFNK
jgi:large subunit ribosomal protein L13